MFRNFMLRFGLSDRSCLLSTMFAGIPLLFICTIEGIIFKTSLDVRLIFLLILVDILVGTSIILRLFKYGKDKTVYHLAKVFAVLVIITVFIIPLMKLL